MFGYVRPYKPDLRIREFDDYKTVYCTLCKRTRKVYGFLSGFTLNYDLAFLAVMLMALDKCDLISQKGRCVYNPLKKCTFCAAYEQIDFCAGVAMLMVFYKLNDSISDSNGLKALFYRFIKMLFSKASKKAKKNHPQIDEKLSEIMKTQFELEKNKCSDIDNAADPTASMLSYILTYRYQDFEKKETLQRLGYCLGRWVYLIDAADDYSTDLKKKNYNVYIEKHGENSELTPEIKEEINRSLNFCAVEAAHMLFDLDIEKQRAILENILTDGLCNMQNFIFSKEKKHDRPL